MATTDRTPADEGAAVERAVANIREATREEVMTYRPAPDGAVRAITIPPPLYPRVSAADLSTVLAALEAAGKRLATMRAAGAPLVAVMSDYEEHRPGYYEDGERMLGRIPRKTEASDPPHVTWGQMKTLAAALLAAAEQE